MSADSSLTAEHSRPQHPAQAVTPVGLYVCAVILTGVPAFLYCLNSAIRTFHFEWLYFGLLVVVASFFPIRIPSRTFSKQSLSVTVSEVFVFTSLLLYSPEVAALLCLLDAALSSVRSKVNKSYKLAFNLSQVCLSTLLAGKLFYFLTGATAPLDPNAIQSPLLLLLYMDLCGLVYYLTSSGSVALAIALATRRPLFRVWEEDDLHWTPLATVAGVSLSTLMFLVLGRLGFLTFVLAILPILLIVYGTFRLTSQRVNDARKHLNEVAELHQSTISSLALAIDAKDECTNGHVHRVQAVALGLAELAGLGDREDLSGLWAASLLHDIGKLATPEFVLNKPTSLTTWEMQKMREHAAAGARILSSIPFPYSVVPLVRHHHEKWDGTGYPDGLRGEEIPLGARIISIADCYDALTSDRPYRSRLTRAAALDILAAEAGKSYDPRLIKVLVENIDVLEARLSEVEKTLPPTLNEGSAPEPDVNEDGASWTLFFDRALGQAEIMQSISANMEKLPLRETLDRLSAEIARMIDYDAAVFYLLEAHSDRLRPFHTSGESAAAFEGLVLYLGEGITGWVAANRHPLYNIPPGPDFQRKRDQFRSFESCLAIPLALNEQVMGTVTLYSKQRNAYSDIPRPNLEVLSRLAVMAINESLIREGLDKLPIQFQPRADRHRKAG